LGRFLVIERLVMRQGAGGIKNVDYAVHSVVDQALDFIVTRGWETYCESWIALYRWRRGHAGRAIEAGGAKRKSWAPNWEWRKNLSDYQKRDRMNFIRVESPGNAVARMNPNFVRQESQGLPAHVGSFCANFGVPVLLGSNGQRERQNGQSGQRKENVAEANRIEIVHVILLYCLNFDQRRVRGPRSRYLFFERSGAGKIETYSSKPCDRSGF